MRFTAFALLLTLLFLLVRPALARDQPTEICAGIATGSGLSPAEQPLRALVAGANGRIYSGNHLQPLKPLGPEMGEYLGRLHTALARQQTRLVLALVPLAPMLYPQDILPPQPEAIASLIESYNNLLAEIRAHGVIAPNLYKAMSGGSRSQAVFFTRDPHWTPYGAKLAAQAVAQSLLNLPEFAGIKRENFTTSIIRKIDFPGKYAELVSRVCHTPIKPEQLNIEQTKAVDNNPDNLLATSSEPDIVLAGTSMSSASTNQFFNFSGALQEALQADVLNVSVGGGNAEAAISTYLISPEFIAHRPKFLIWELPAYYRLNDTNLFRQLIPAAKGACNTALGLASDTTTIQGSREILRLAGNIAQQHDYLYLETSDLSLTSLTLRFTYSDGLIEEMEIARSLRAANHGRFFMETSRAGLVNASIIPPSPASRQITVRLCPADL